MCCSHQLAKKKKIVLEYLPEIDYKLSGVFVNSDIPLRR